MCDIHTRTRNFYEFCTTFIPVPEPSVSSVRPWHNTRGTGTTFVYLRGTSVSSARLHIPTRNFCEFWKTVAQYPGTGIPLSQCPGYRYGFGFLPHKYRVCSALRRHASLHTPSTKRKSTRKPRCTRHKTHRTHTTHNTQHTTHNTRTKHTTAMQLIVVYPGRGNMSAADPEGFPSNTGGGSSSPGGGSSSPPGAARDA